MRLTKKETVDYMVKKLRKMEEHYNEVINIKSDGNDALCERKISAERDYVEYKQNNQDEYRYVKLGQLEDIEDELGIDLITLFKALKNGGVYVKNSITEDTAIKMHSFQICGDDNGITIWSQLKLNVKDYGKTWALTKEELL